MRGACGHDGEGDERMEAELAERQNEAIRRNGSDINDALPATVGALFPTTSARYRAPIRIVSIVLRIVLFIVSHCSCAGGFFVALSRPCIVIGGNFPL